jgi:hypothetical protein
LFNTNVDRPIKIKIGVRDKWTASDSPVQKALKELKETVGLDIAVEPQWPMLWTELSGAFKEPELFVPTIADSVASWAGALGEICDDDCNEAWTEQFLEKAKASGSMIRIELEVGQTQHDEPEINRYRR